MELTDLTNAQLTGAYRNLRSRKEDMVAVHKTELAPTNDAMSNIEHEFLSRMEKTDTQSFKTENGTAYKSTVSQVTVKNHEAFFSFLQVEGLWELADLRAGKKEVEAYLEEHGELPPGLDINRRVKCNVRANAKV